MTELWVFLVSAIGCAMAGIPFALRARRTEHPKYRNADVDEQRGAL